MKTIIFLCVSIACAFAFDIIFGQLIGGIIPPLVVMVIFYWFWHLDLGQGLLLGIISGITLDTIGFLPSGIYTFMFICTVFLCIPMKNFFSNTESRSVVMLNIIILTSVFRLLVSPLSLLVQFLGFLA